MCLDSVPATSQIRDYWSIYDDKFNGNKYKSIHYFVEDLPGQIQYYVNPEMTDPFFSPLFPTNTKAVGAVYVDPMNRRHYDFRRIPPPTDSNRLRCESKEFRDSQNHREDMLSNIMRSRNKIEYEPVYFNFNTRYR
jgi:hypothetical protein